MILTNYIKYSIYLHCMYHIKFECKVPAKRFLEFNYRKSTITIKNR